jgi:uroporphyrin-III C-methyltransferase
MRGAGKVYLIGAGPGDPDLLTLKALRALKEADVILYDRLVEEATLSYSKPGAESIYVGKRHGEQERTQAQIFDLMLTHARAGRIVARLKGGDPCVFGRGAEEWKLALESGVACEIIPGVSSAIAVPELAGIPLTYRKLSQSFAVVTGHESEDGQAWQRHAHIDTLVILMGVKNRTDIAVALIKWGRASEEPVAFIERGTTEHERIVVSTLGAVAAGQVNVINPAVWVIGKVVELRSRLKPLR